MDFLKTKSVDLQNAQSEFDRMGNYEILQSKKEKDNKSKYKQDDVEALLMNGKVG